MSMTQENMDLRADLRTASGNFNKNSALVSFLYELMRDHVTPGVVQKLMAEAVENTDCQYSNGFLAQYADYLAKKLTQEQGS